MNEMSIREFLLLYPSAARLWAANSHSITCLRRPRKFKCLKRTRNGIESVRFRCNINEYLIIALSVICRFKGCSFYIDKMICVYSFKKYKSLFLTYGGVCFVFSIVVCCFHILFLFCFVVWFGFVMGMGGGLKLDSS